MRPTEQEYAELTRRASPASHTLRDVLRAFCSGGLICLLAQGLLTLYQASGLPDEQARGFVSITLIAASALLTALRVYDKAAAFCGAGTLVPITGFANAVAAPAIEFRTEKLVTGTCAKLFTIAGPVLAAGVVSSTVYGLVLLAAKRFY